MCVTYRRGKQNRNIIVRLRAEDYQLLAAFFQSSEAKSTNGSKFKISKIYEGKVAV